MGKNLKGKQLGKGLGQRKDGLYYARCRNYRGEREERCFKTLPEAKNWRQEQLYLRLHPEGRTVASPNMTVDAWFNQWVKDVVGNRAPNTVRNYRERYEHNIQPFIGSMLLRDVKQIDCQRILNAMEDDYAGSTIRQTYMTRVRSSKAPERTTSLPNTQWTVFATQSPFVHLMISTF